MRRLLIVLALLLAAACEPIAGLEDARRISGEPFRADFMATAECVGVSEDSARSLFADTRWYRAPDMGDGTFGYWSEPHSIYLRRGHNIAPFVVRHEVIHLLIQDGDHDHWAFGSPDHGADACEGG